jgi:hypothetical protein
MRLSCGPRSSWDNPSSAGWADDECLATIITPWAPMSRSRCRGQTDGWRCGQDGTAGSRPAARSQGFREIRLRVDRSSARRIVSSTEILPGTEKAVNRPPSSSRRRCLQKQKKRRGAILSVERRRDRPKPLGCGVSCFICMPFAARGGRRRRRGAACATIPSWCYRRDLSCARTALGRGCLDGALGKPNPCVSSRCWVFQFPPAFGAAGGSPSVFASKCRGKLGDLTDSLS